MTMEYAVYCVFFFMGASIGSFLNVVISRLPAGESVVRPRSRCPGCRTPIAWYDNVPLVSYLLLQGRCRHCHGRISPLYPLVEIAMGGVTLAVFYWFGFSFATAGFLFFAASLVAVTVIDAYHQIIPDVISLPGIAAGFAFSIFNPLVTWQESLLGILAGGGILFSVAWAYYLVTKREGMGGGDIKLLAMIGAFLGWQSIPFVVFVSAALGSAIGIIGIVIQRFANGQCGGRLTRIPFGPFLSVAALVFLLVPQAVAFFFTFFSFAP